MNQTVTAGIQSFERIKDRDVFYIDKTAFIREWWESKDDVTLITRPRRFGKTLNMSMLECFFSTRYAGRGDLFEGLEIWKDEKYRALQGTLPVISVSFARVKRPTFKSAVNCICNRIEGLFSCFHYLMESSFLSPADKQRFDSYERGLTEDSVIDSLWWLSKFLSATEGKNVVILLDEYDAPLQEAWMNGYWKEMSSLMRALFNATFKENSFLDRGVLTGVTRVSKESMFSDLNNLNVASVLTDGQYETAFGFTEEEVFAAMDRYGFSDRLGVKNMYDGFTFGSRSDIYNPWSIISYLKKGKLKRWWVNTSSNELVGKLLWDGSPKMKARFGSLLHGEPVRTELNENIVFDQLESDPAAVWSLLVEAGYLKAVPIEGEEVYNISITNGEVREMFEELIGKWFTSVDEEKSSFIRSMLAGDIAGMNKYMETIALSVFSSFDTGKQAGKKQPERFYHGFVLGLVVDLRGRFTPSSNVDSGHGRYDLVLDPCDVERDDGFIFEFKAINPEEEEDDLPDSVSKALCQIEDQRYDAKLLEHLPPERIRKYAFAFSGKKVLIDDASGVGRAAYMEKRKRIAARKKKKAAQEQA